MSKEEKISKINRKIKMHELNRRANLDSDTMDGIIKAEQNLRRIKDLIHQRNKIIRGF